MAHPGPWQHQRDDRQRCPRVRQRLVTGDRVLIGNSLLEFDGAGLAEIQGSMFVVETPLWRSETGRRIVDDVSFAIRKPSLVAVIGPSGAGKSGLLRLVTGQVSPTAGSVSLDGAWMRASGGHIEDTSVWCHSTRWPMDP